MCKLLNHKILIIERQFIVTLCKVYIFLIIFWAQKWENCAQSTQFGRRKQIKKGGKHLLPKKGTKIERQSFRINALFSSLFRFVFCNVRILTLCVGFEYHRFYYPICTQNGKYAIFVGFVLSTLLTNTAQ